MQRTSQQFVCGNWTIHCVQQGQGPALILLHGGLPGTSGEGAFAHNIDALAAHFTVYVPDFPGWGQSSKNLLPVGQWGNPLAAGGEAVVALMDALKLKSAFLMGNSFGASAAVYAALKAPQRIAGMVLMAPGGGALPAHRVPHAPLIRLLDYYMGAGPSRAKFDALMQSMTHDPGVLSPQWKEDRYRASLDPAVCANPPLRHTPAAPPGAQPLHQEAGLRTLTVPTLLIWGEDDGMQPIECMPSFQVIPDSESLVIAECGHWPHREHTERVHAAVVDFARRHHNTSKEYNT